MTALLWTEWRVLPLSQPIPAKTLTEQLDGGQSFRWEKEKDDTWIGPLSNSIVSLRQASTHLEWRTCISAACTESFLLNYFDAQGKQAELVDHLPWRSDAVLHGALKNFPGLRILKHDPHETLIGFLCSSNKRILQIRKMVANLANQLGEPIAGSFNQLPSWSVLAQATDAELKACALGYRANFIRNTARVLESNPEWAEEFQKLSTPDLIEKLQTLPGVGPKVAACVALFGFQRLDSFPVDTWIIQALSSTYGLDFKQPKHFETFGRVHFGSAAGLAQQYLFAAARAGQLAPKQ
jgi:N-glycosylase/DNA lyase